MPPLWYRTQTGIMAAIIQMNKNMWRYDRLEERAAGGATEVPTQRGHRRVKGDRQIHESLSHQ
jgi:hypothetical protein